MLVQAVVRLMRLNLDTAMTTAHLCWILFQSKMGVKLCNQLNLNHAKLVADLATRIPRDAPQTEFAFCKRFADAIERCQEPTSQAEWRLSTSLIVQALSIEELVLSQEFQAQTNSKKSSATEMCMSDEDDSSNRSPKRKSFKEEYSTLSTSSVPLARFGVDLVEKVSKIHPVICRDAEIARIQEIVTRSSGYCPVLIGKPGVGKTTILLGLAQRIACENVPDDLLDSQIWALDTNMIIKALEDETEGNMLVNALAEAETRGPKPMLFITNLHELLVRSSGKTRAQQQHQANVMKALLLGKLRVIATTTPEAHRLHFSKSRYGQRFQQLHVREMSPQSAFKVLQSISGVIAQENNMHVDEAAIVQAVVLAREVTNLAMPCSAINLLRTACTVATKNNKERSEHSDSVMACLNSLESISLCPTPLESLASKQSHLLQLSNSQHAVSKRRHTCINEQHQNGADEDGEVTFDEVHVFPGHVQEALAIVSRVIMA